MTVRKGNLTGFVGDEVLDADDFDSLEGQTIRPVANRAGLAAVFGSNPVAGFAWLEDTEELVGWDGSNWVTISTGFEKPIVKLPEADDGDRTTLHGPVQTHRDNNYWHDESVGQRISARNSALTGAQTWRHNPFGLVDSTNVEVFRTRTGGAAVWQQQDLIVSRHKVTITAIADADVEFVLVGAGGSGRRAVTYFGNRFTRYIGLVCCPAVAVPGAKSDR